MNTTYNSKIFSYFVLYFTLHLIMNQGGNSTVYTCMITASYTVSKPY